MKWKIKKVGDIWRVRLIRGDGVLMWEGYFTEWWLVLYHLWYGDAIWIWYRAGGE